MKFSKQALDELKKCKHVIDTEVSANKLDNLWVGLSPKNWFSKFDKSLHVSNLSEKSMNRKELLELIVSYRRNGKIVPSAVRELIISIYAWGGMRRDKNTGILAINTISAYEDVCSKLLNGMSSLSAFKEFYELQKSGSMDGALR
tara:strand:+ start:917 stop:1351 length:435 start_codon:yes stop_codon:yes gene_type:complete